jgi:hypothetical protein
MLWFSEFLFRSIGILIVFDVLGNDSDFFLSFSKGISGILSQFSQSNNLSLMVSDSLLKIIDEFLARNLIVFVDGVSSLLVTLNLWSDVIGEEIDLINRGSSSKVQLDNWENGVSECVLVDFSENGFSVLEFVLLIGESQGNN